MSFETIGAAILGSAAAAGAGSTATAGAGMAALGSATSVLGTGMRMLQSRQQAKYQQQVANNNATLAQMNAQDALDRGRLAKQNKRLQNRALAGKQRAMLGASGVELESGSALEMQVDSAEMAEMDLLQIEANAQREAWRHSVHAGHERAQGELAMMAGANNATQSFMQGMGSLLKDGRKVADRWNRKQPPTLPKPTSRYF
ncbi:hypothetical protein [Magnetococcus sp. PR-3]|uniref:hypothetical protein n=1 Tax=Magnetococcus sp. PR-3 TaxID=3120355 RepID=UPI002FCDEE36